MPWYTTGMKPLPQYDQPTPAQTGIPAPTPQPLKAGTYSAPMIPQPTRGTGITIVVFPSRWVYPSQFARLQAAGVHATGKKGFAGVSPADRWGYEDQGEYGYVVNFPDAADLALAQSTGATMFTDRPHGDANWWIINPDIGVLRAAGAPFTITKSGRAFSKLLLHEYEIWKTLYDGLAFHIQQKYKVDPNTFVDPNISLPEVMPTPGTAIPATPEAVLTTPAAPAAPAAAAAPLPPITLPYSDEIKAATQAATQPAAPVVYYPAAEAAVDVPQLAPATTPAAAPAAAGGGAAAGLTVGVLLLMLMRK